MRGILADARGKKGKHVELEPLPAPRERPPLPSKVKGDQLREGDLIRSFQDFAIVTSNKLERRTKRTDAVLFRTAQEQGTPVPAFQTWSEQVVRAALIRDINTLTTKRSQRLWGDDVVERWGRVVG